jgi:hypothetical protein
MSERPCPVCGTNHNGLCARIAKAVNEKRGGAFLWAAPKPAKPLIPLCIHAGCGKRAHWGSCEAPRPRYFPGEPGYGLSEAERAQRIAAGLPMFASDVDATPVHKAPTSVHKPTPVDAKPVHKDSTTDVVDAPVDASDGVVDLAEERRRARKREWMAKKRAAKDAPKPS